MASRKTKDKRFIAHDYTKAIVPQLAYSCTHCGKQSGGTHDNKCRDCGSELLKLK